MLLTQTLFFKAFSKKYDIIFSLLLSDLSYKPTQHIEYGSLYIYIYLYIFVLNRTIFSFPSRFLKFAVEFCLNIYACTTVGLAGV